MSFLRALVQGLGFGTGIEVVREAVRAAKDEAPAPEETLEQRTARLERELRAAEAAHAEAERQREVAKRARGEKKERDARDVDQELAELKKKLGR